MGYIRKALEKGYWNTLGLHAVLTTCLRFSSVLDGACALPAASFCQQADTMSAYKFTSWAVASPDAPQKPLVRKKAGSGGAEWVQGTRHPAKQAEKPYNRFTASCMHPQGSQILTTAEATSFASQLWDRKVHPTKASQHELKKYVPIHKQGDVCPNGVPAPCGREQQCRRFGIGITSGPQGYCSVPCIIEFPAVCSKIWSPGPPNQYISETAVSHRFQQVYTYPPPKGNDILAHRTKSSKTPGKMPKPTELAHNGYPREILLSLSPSVELARQ